MTPVESAIQAFVQAHAEAETRFLAEIVKIPSEKIRGGLRPRRHRRRQAPGGVSGSRSNGRKVPDDLTKATGMISSAPT